jgi:hypothetical protein
MFILSKLFVAALTLGAGLLAAGCQTSGTTAMSGSDSPTTEPVALACSKCETTYKKVAVTGGNPRSGFNIVRYRTVADHECPECTNVVKSWFSYNKSRFPGEVVHSCKSCGGEVKVCHEEKI